MLPVQAQFYFSSCLSLSRLPAVIALNISVRLEIILWGRLSAIISNWERITGVLLGSECRMSGFGN